MNCLMQITDRLLNVPKKTSVLQDELLAEEIADLVLQIDFNLIVRSMIKKKEMWSMFKSTLSNATKWTKTITNWGVHFFLFFFFFCGSNGPSGLLI